MTVGGKGKLRGVSREVLKEPTAVEVLLFDSR